jgi:hypothetical protein
MSYHHRQFFLFIPACIINGTKSYLGSFDTVEKAKAARLEAERKILEEHPRKK